MFSFLRKLRGEEAERAEARLAESYEKLKAQADELDTLMEKLQQARETTDSLSEELVEQKVKVTTISGQMKAVRPDEPQDDSSLLAARRKLALQGK